MKKHIATFFLLLLSSSIYCQWSHEYFVDDFGDKTTSDYIQQIIKTGSFSNSATPNGSLLVNVFLSYNYNEEVADVRFKLLEYGNHPVGKTVGDAKYTLYLKNPIGYVSKFKLDAMESSFFVDRLDTLSKSEIINCLKSSTTDLKCMIDVKSEYSHQQYNFSIDPMGFSKAFTLLKPNLSTYKMDSTTRKSINASLLKIEELSKIYKEKLREKQNAE